jgi:hypothetical protein
LSSQLLLYVILIKFLLLSDTQLQPQRTCKKGPRKCRFNFPRPPAFSSFIAEPTNNDDQEHKKAKATFETLLSLLEHPPYPPLNCDQLLQKLNITETQYMHFYNILTQRPVIIYKRDPANAWVNPYNETLLLAWDGNIDIQPVLDAYSCIMYVISYISKAELELGILLKNVEADLRDGNLHPMHQLRSLGNVFLQNRDISVMEAIYRITSMPLKRSSREVIFLPSDPQSIR